MPSISDQQAQASEAQIWAQGPYASTSTVPTELETPIALGNYSAEVGERESGNNANNHIHTIEGLEIEIEDDAGVEVDDEDDDDNASLRSSLKNPADEADFPVEGTAAVGYAPDHQDEGYESRPGTAQSEETRTSDKTFGVELEFLIACEKHSSFDEDVLVVATSGDGSVFSAAAEIKKKLANNTRCNLVTAIRNAGIPCNDYQGAQDFQSWTVEDDGSISERGELNQALVTFSGGQQVVMTPQLREKWFLVSVEITSRILPASPDSMREIEALLTVLRREPTLVNETTGLHVHVGQGNSGFDLRTLKNLLFFGTMFEGHVANLHPIERLNNPGACLQPRMTFDPKERHPQAIFARLESFQSVADLVRWWHTERRDRANWRRDDAMLDGHHAYNVLNLAPGMPKQTIEFRAAAGTLDPGAVVRWVMFVLNIVRIAQERGHPFVNAYNRLEDPNHGILDVMRDLNLGMISGLYEGHTFAHTEPIRDPEIEEE